MRRAHWPRMHVAAPCVTHIILADFDRLGLAFNETTPGQTFAEAVAELASFDKVVGVFCLDEEAGTFRDVTSDVADHLARRPWDELAPSEREICERFGTAPEDPDGEDEALDGYDHQRREAVYMGHF